MKSKSKHITLKTGIKVDVSKFDVDQLQILYKRALYYQRLRAQWAGHADFQRAAHYDSMLEAMIETIESVTVYNIGNGIHPFEPRAQMVDNTTSLDDRLTSIGLLFEPKRKVGRPPKAKETVYEE